MENEKSKDPSNDNKMNDMKHKNEEQNPESGIQDQNKQTHTTQGNTKKSFKVQDQINREDIIEQNQNNKPRDSI